MHDEISGLKADLIPDSQPDTISDTMPESISDPMIGSRIDPFGRPVRSIRISVTDTCDLSCYYCHNEGQTPNGNLMSPEEIERILKISSKIGIRKVKLTGGEPLLRKDILDIVERASIHMGEVSITTDGTRLSELAQSLKQAGLARVNVSLDTFDPARYERITGKNVLSIVLEGIHEAVRTGLDPVKINIVALPDSTPEDLLATIQGVWDLGAVPQLIELVRKDDNFTSLSGMESAIAAKALGVKERRIHRRRKYVMLDGEGVERELELVRPMHNTEFCANCTRLRVTSGGMIKPCLMHNEDLVDILTPIRNGAGDDELVALFEEAIGYRKPYWK